MTTLTHARLLELLHYDPETGVFTRKQSTGKCKAGTVFGCRNGHGYTHGWLGRQTAGDKIFKCHHLAWFYVYGEMPTQPIDHIDGVRDNNRIANLRLTNYVLNGQNQRRRKRGSDLSLPFGVTRNGSGFCARICLDKKVYSLGTFKTPKEAGDIYRRTKELFHV
jgi:hypothetical protein